MNLIRPISNLKLLIFLCSLFVFIQTTLANKNSHSILVAFGYIDSVNTQETHDDVLDPIFYSSLVDTLLSTCPNATEKLCGFKKAHEDPDTDDDGYVELKKNSRGNKTITIHVVKSSLNQSHQWNMKNNQFMRSQRVLDIISSLGNSIDSFFYVGHSRYGHGPDFFPAKTKNSAIDIEFYNSSSAGIDFIIKSFPPTLKHLGLYSCTSSKHFRSLLSRKFSKTKMIFSESAMSADDAYVQFLDNLEKIL